MLVEASPAEGPVEEKLPDAAGEGVRPQDRLALLKAMPASGAISFTCCGPLPADIAAEGDAALPEENAAVTADGAPGPDSPAALVSELDPSAEAMPVDQVLVGPVGVLEPVVEEPAAVQPDAAAAQGAPEGSAANEAAVAQVAKQPSVAFRLAGQGGTQQVG